MNKKKGFTLIELIVVIEIIAVLMMIIVPTMIGITSSSKKEANLANAKSIYTAVLAQNTAHDSGLTTSSDSYAKIDLKEDEISCESASIHSDFYDVYTIPAETCKIMFGDGGKISVVYGETDATKATYPQQ